MMCEVNELCDEKRLGGKRCPYRPPTRRRRRIISFFDDVCNNTGLISGESFGGGGGAGWRRQGEIGGVRIFRTFEGTQMSLCGGLPKDAWRGRTLG